MNTQPLTNTFRAPKAHTVRPASPRTGSAYLFREAYLSFCDALFCLFRIELPARWKSWKARNICEFHAEYVEDNEHFVSDLLCVVMLLLCAVAVWGAIWIWWIVTHPAT